MVTLNNQTLTFSFSVKLVFTSFKDPRETRSHLGPISWDGRLSGRVLLVLKFCHGPNSASSLVVLSTLLVFKMIGVMTAVTALQCSFGAREAAFFCALTNSLVK